MNIRKYFKYGQRNGTIGLGFQRLAPRRLSVGFVALLSMLFLCESVVASELEGEKAQAKAVVKKRVAKLPSNEHAFETRSADSFKGISLPVLIRRYADNFLPPGPGFEEECSPVYSAILEDSVQFIEPDWVVTDYEDERLDEFKHCTGRRSDETWRMLRNKEEYRTLNVDLSKESFNSTLTKYTLNVGGNDIVWISTIPRLRYYSSLISGSISHIIDKELCVIDTNSSSSLILEHISENTQNIRLVKNGLFLEDGFVYGFTFESAPVRGPSILRFRRLGHIKGDVLEQITEPEKMFCSFSNHKFILNAFEK